MRYPDAAARGSPRSWTDDLLLRELTRVKGIRRSWAKARHALSGETDDEKRVQRIRTSYLEWARPTRRWLRPILRELRRRGLRR